MPNVQISWLNSASVVDDSSLILEVPTLEASVSDPLAARIVYKVMYLRNNGPGTVGTSTDPTAYNSGFFISGYGPEYEDNHHLEHLLQWASLSDGGGLPYGAFTVFGYDDASGTNSYVDKFIANTLTVGELNMFQHTWTQGIGPSNKISLDTSYRYVNGAYVQLADLGGYSDALGALPSGETNGLVKVLFGVRIPDSIAPVRALVNHNLFYEEANV